MKIVAIMGGLGNQLFQYAFGVYLSSQYGEVVSLNLGMLGMYGNRQCELELLGLNFQTVDDEMVGKIVGPVGGRPRIRRLLASSLGQVIRPRNFVCEPDWSIEVEGELIQSQQDLYFHGYWQEIRFCGVHAGGFIDRFRFPPAVDSTHKFWLRKIRASPSLAIHVRRGDYVKSRAARRKYGEISTDYFISAVNLHASRFGKPTIFIFTDDKPYALEEILPRLKGFTVDVVDLGSAPAWLDMHLMSQCDHMIISNSTFSWWSAMLNRNPKKQIIYPVPWQANGLEPRGFIPSDWIGLRAARVETNSL